MLKNVAIGACVLALGLEGQAWAVPNVILIIADDYGSDKLRDFVWNGGTGATNFPYTPNLNELGNAGLRFTDAWANPVCSPTRAALNTGDYAWRSNIGVALEPGATNELGDVEILPTKLYSEASYQTALFGKWHLGEHGSPTTTTWSGTAGSKGAVGSVFPPPLRRGNAATPIDGYDSYDGFIGGGVGSGSTWKRIYVPTSPGTTWQLADESGYPDEIEIQAAADWIENVGYPSGDPWLAVVALAAPHTRGTGYAEADVTLDTTCARKNVLSTPYNYCLTHSTGAGSTCTPQQIFQGLVECMDERVDDFLDLVAAIDGGGAVANTIVVFMGDNGTLEVAMETPYTDPTHDVGKGQVYQSGVRVPFIIADFTEYADLDNDDSQLDAQVITGPGVNGLSVTSLVQSWDLYATLVDAAGGTDGTESDATSLYTCFTSTSATCAGTTRFHYAETFEDSNVANPNLGLTDGAKASVGFSVTGTGAGEYSMIATYTAATNCMNSALFRLTGTGSPTADPQQQNAALTNGSAGYLQSMCTTGRTKFATANSGWMPRASGAINWCAACPAST